MKVQALLATYKLMQVHLSNSKETWEPLSKSLSMNIELMITFSLPVHLSMGRPFSSCRKSLRPGSICSSEYDHHTLLSYELSLIHRTISTWLLRCNLAISCYSVIPSDMSHYSITNTKLHSIYAQYRELIKIWMRLSTNHTWRDVYTMHCMACSNCPSWLWLHVVLLTHSGQINDFIKTGQNGNGPDNWPSMEILCDIPMLACRVLHSPCTICLMTHCVYASRYA